MEINFNMVHIKTGLLSSLMVFILVMQGNVSRTIPEGAINIMTDFECQADSDCFEKNTYCDISLNLCLQCINCSIYFREPKTHIKCSKNISDCSNCLEGFLEETFYGGEIRDICVPIDSNIILPTPAKIISDSYWLNIGVIFIIINMLLISLLWTFFYKRFWNTSLNDVSVLQGNVENELPSYDSCMKLNNYVTDDIQEFHLFTGEQPPINEWRHQNAVPFRFPEELLETNNCMDENENIEEVDGTITREIENPELHDEETMPSSWIPPLPSSTSVIINFHNETSQMCSPPFKRMRLVQQPTNEKSYQDEENASDLSQDE